MNRSLNRAGALLAVLGFTLVVAACNKKEETPVSQGPPGGMPGGSGGPGFGPGMGGPGGSASPIGRIMAKLTKGPQSLTSVIGDELQANPPEWDKLQSQTKEYVELASSMAKHDPPKGSKESWTKLAGEFADCAVALDKAAQAKDKDAAVAAHRSLTSSCTACHQQHRAGLGGFGPPGGGFGPPGKGGGFPMPGKGGFPTPGKDLGFPPPKDGAAPPPKGGEATPKGKGASEVSPKD